MKKTEGFSLIELLVVVAIIMFWQLLALLGYQQYIDNKGGRCEDQRAKS